MLQIPTDNFYKFLSLTSLALFMFFLFAPAYYENQLKISSFQLDSELATIGKKITLSSAFEKSANSFLLARVNMIELQTKKIEALNLRAESLLHSKSINSEDAKKLIKLSDELIKENATYLDALNKQLEFSIKISAMVMKNTDLHYKSKEKLEILKLNKTNLKKLESYKTKGSWFFGLFTVIGFGAWLCWQRKHDKKIYP